MLFRSESFSGLNLAIRNVTIFEDDVSSEDLSSASVVSLIYVIPMLAINIVLEPYAIRPAIPAIQP